MPEGLIKKGAGLKSQFTQEYLSKVNLALLIVVIIMLGGLIYSSVIHPSFAQKTEETQVCTKTSDGIITNIYEHLGDKEILITNTTVTNQDNNLCYLTYMCVNNTPDKCTPSCIETNSNEDCMMNNSKCCSGCCKYRTNGQSLCVSESECSQQLCRQENQACSGTLTVGYAVATYNYSNYCCPGLTCSDGICKKQCSETSRTCVSTSDCCSGLTCLMGLCSSSSCVPETQTCFHDYDCCSGLTCTNNLCTKPYCAHLSETCGYGTDCCSGLNCVNNFCANPYCANVSQTCFGNSDCCSGLTCQNGFCYNCIPYKQTCLNDSWCCSGICTNGFCDD